MANGCGERSERQNKRGAGRESIWSVSERWKAVFFSLFSVSTFTTTCVIIAYEIANRGDAALMDVYATITQRVFVSGGALGLTIYSATETWETMMVLANYLRQNLLEPLKERQREEGRVQGRVQGVEEGVIKGREEGREESDAKWLAWNERREKAASNGEPFDEPPPVRRRDEG